MIYENQTKKFQCKMRERTSLELKFCYTPHSQSLKPILYLILLCSVLEIENGQTFRDVTFMWLIDSKQGFTSIYSGDSVSDLNHTQTSYTPA